MANATKTLTPKPRIQLDLSAENAKNLLGYIDSKSGATPDNDGPVTAELRAKVAALSVDDYTVDLKLSAFEAQALAAVLMYSVLWEGHEFGQATQNVYEALVNEAEVREARWMPDDENAGEQTISRMWRKK
jgi:hypothetical protein